MASRYWVGGSASWDGTAGTKWATTSGGAGGASVPTSADDVFFDANSGAVTVTLGTSVNCANLTFTGFTGTISGFWTITAAGSVVIAAGMNYNVTGELRLSAASGAQTFTTNGKTLNSPVYFGINASTATFTLQDALTITGSLTVDNGTFDTNNFNVTASSLISNASSTRTIKLGSSTVTLSGSTAVNFTTNTGLTFNAGTSTIVLNGTSSGITGAAASATGVTFYNVSFTSTSADTRYISGINTFNNIAVTGPSAAGVVQFYFNAPQTINGTLSTTGTAGNRRVWFRGFTYGIAQTLTINSAPSLTDADFRDIYVVGTAAPISGTRVGNLAGCRGITFSTPKTVYWVTAAGGNWSGNNWAATSGGAASTDNFPLAQDTAKIENTGLNAAAVVTMDSAISYTGTVDMSARTTAMSFNLNVVTASIYGDFKNGSGTSYNNGNMLSFAGRKTQTITSAGISLSGPITIDSYGGTVQLADALNIGSNNLTVTNGTFNTKNYNVTFNALSSSNSNVRSIVLGSSTLTLTGSVAMSTSTNMTFNAGTSQINMPAGGAFDGGGLTFYNVTYTGGGSGTSTQAFTGANTFNNLTFTAPSAGLVNCTFAANQTISGTLTCAGASAVQRIFVRSDTLGTTRTLTVNSLSATDCDFRDITIAGAAAGSSPTRAGDCGGNTGITFPGAKTVYWNLAGAQNWSATGWASSSGGSPAINNFPLAQDTAKFDNTGSVTGTITINAAWNIGTLDASARTSAMTLQFSAASDFSVYGDWKFGTGVTQTAAIGSPYFRKRGTQTITSNGVSFASLIYIDSVTGTVQLADALNASGGLQLFTGTFDAVTYNVTATTASFQNVSNAIVKMGSGTWTLTSSGTIWSLGTSTVLYKGTANIVLSDTSTNARTFSGAGLSYNKLTIGGTTGTSTLTINGNNQFTELASTKTVAHTIALGTTTPTFGKWSVTGTVGNVVTVTGTATLTIAGAAVSGVDYLAMGTTALSTTSPGEFYAGANSTGTGAGITLTAAPAGRTLYWVGGTGNWSSTTKWSTSSGGASGAAIPTSLDDVIFNSASNATAYTATIDPTQARCKSLTIAGPASGNVTIAGSGGLACHGSVSLAATGITRTYTGAITLSSSSTGLTFTTNGNTLASAITVNGVSCGWTLGSALDMTGQALTVTNGSLSLSSYNVTAFSIGSINSNIRTLNLGSSTITLTGNFRLGTSLSESSSLTLTAGTSQINLSGTQFDGNGQTLYNLSLTSTSPGSVILNGANTFNNLSFTGLTSAGLKNISIYANQTVNGTLTFSAGTNATMRHFCRSDTIGTTRTITTAAFSGTDVDFRDITIAGAAAPVSGTRLGDAKGNSGITFVAGKTVYVRSTGSANWSSSTGWSATSGGAADVTQFPLAQDTAVFPAATYPASGSTITIDYDYNIGTIDMSARTSNTMTLATGTTNPTIYGNWINGTGTTLTGNGTITWSGRGSQTITNAGKTFTCNMTINSPGGTVTLSDALSNNYAGGTIFTLTAGTFDAAGYNVTFSGGGFASTNSNTRAIAVGSGTWSFAGATPWNCATSTGLTVTGTGTISLTSASAKTFAGGGLSYSGITLDQGGAGALTITGNNTFKNITNSYSATGATNITLGTTTQTVTQFTATGTSGKVLTVQGTSASSPGTLILTSGTVSAPDYLTITGVRAYSLDTTWYAGANSTNNGSLGWYFSAYTPVVTSTGNFFLMFG